MGSDKESTKAHQSLIDPLIEPDPSDETGLNSHFRSSFAPRQNPPSPPVSAGLHGPASDGIRSHHTGSTVETNPFIRYQNTGSTAETNPYRRSRGPSLSSKAPTFASQAEVITPNTPRRRYDYPSPPNSASPMRESFSHRSEAFASLNEGSRPRRSSQPSSPTPPFQNGAAGGGLTRGGSLRERYPGDMSARPLDLIRKDTKAASRAYHLRKKNFQGTDTIDRLDSTGFSYHHEGPYDAANIARNRDWKHSPIAAVQDSNEEALRATPRENIIDAVTKHRPIEGVANIPPGVPDRFGRVLDYEEGADLQREPGGDYRRWAGVEYRPEDLKGKGEPSYSIEKALKDHKQYGDTGTEMTSRRRNQSLGTQDRPRAPVESVDGGSGLERSNTTGKSVGNTLKKRFGSLRRRRVAS